MTSKTILAVASIILLPHALPAAACDDSDLPPSKPAQLCNVVQDAGLASHFMVLRLCRLERQLRDAASASPAQATPPS